MDEQTLKQYLADSPPSVVQLGARPHFEALTDKQQRYAHHISRASFIGTRIILRQVSPESESIFDLIIALYKGCNRDLDGLLSQTNVSKDDLNYFLEYATQFLGNCGNYKGFGDSKFVPRLSTSAFATLVSKTPDAKAIFERLGGENETNAMYANASKPGLMHLGFPNDGHLSNYYPESPNITQSEIEAVGTFLEGKDILPENTRLCKLPSGDFEVLIASGLSTPASSDIDSPGGETQFSLNGSLKGRTLRLVFGDYQKEMARIAEHMSKAAESAEHERQKEMMQQYAKSFNTGSLKAFKESQKLWVKDLGPMVESNIGFIENYRDPAGVRSEWEGFAAMVNKERTKAFGKLVLSAGEMVPKLPWSHDFEKDKFTPPDFTSLEILSFASTGIPAGINIPNYDDIRQEIGFKNVSLGNVLSASAPNEPIPLIHPDDLETYRTNRDLAFEVQVGIHELLGHGTGKLLQETSTGVFNFDHANPPISPVTRKPITTYYRPGQTWSSVFGSVASSYEECRAECVAMALGCEPRILEIFGLPLAKDGGIDLDGPAGDVLHAGYLSMARAGLAALEFWDPRSRKWGQAHMQARFSILQVMLRAGEGLVQLYPPGVEEGKANIEELCVRVDRRKIVSVGRPAVENYLQALHVYKSTADVAAGTKLYEEATNVDGWWATEARAAIMKKRPPRRVFVQGNTVEKTDGTIGLEEYPPTLMGMIQSFGERHI